MIEMIISLGIFAIVTGFVMANFHSGNQGDELRLAAQLVVSTVRRVQTMAVAGQTVHICRDLSGNDGRVCPSGSDTDCPGGSTCVSDVPRGGYGVHFDGSDAGKRTMITFADTNNDKMFEADEEIRRDNVSPNIYVNVIGLTPAAPGPVLDVIFVPPKPSVLFNGSSDQAAARITIQHQSSMQIRNIDINAVSGQVSSD